MQTPSVSPVPATVIVPIPTELAGPRLPTIPGYEVLDLVGRGGMGKVFRARNKALDRVVAIKLLAHEPDEKSLARFSAEARAVARLQHPNIAQLFESGSVDGQPYYAQEFLEGGSLDRKFNGSPQDPREAARLVATVARAIEHCHAHGVLHRDLKPGNILLAADGTPKVTDFGLAKELTSAAGQSTGRGGITRTGEIVGTPAYMPPEQASGVFGTIGPPADVYALGAILYEALTGRPPFQAPDPMQTLFLVLSMEPVSPRALQPGLPRDLETICLKCLDKSPKHRYAGAAALADDLQRYLTGRPIVARPAGLPERALKWARREPWQAGVCAFVVAGVLALAGGFLWVTKKNAEVHNANASLEGKNAELQETNRLLVKSQEESEALLNTSLATMDRYYFGLGAKLADVPRAEHLRVEVLNQAKESLLHLYNLNPRREAVWEYLLAGFNKLGQAQMQVGDLTAAADSFQKAADAADNLLAAHPDNLTHRINRAGAQFNAANVLERVGKTDDAARLRTEAGRAADDILAENPRHAGALALSQTVNRRRLLEAYDSGNPATIEAALRAQCDLDRRLSELEPDKAGHRLIAANDALHLVRFLGSHRKLGEADDLLAQAEKWTAELPNATAAEVRVLRGKLHECRGTLLQERKQYAEADAEYRKGLAIARALAADFPDTPSVLVGEADSWTWIGLNWKDAGRIAEAKAAFTQARHVADRLAKRFAGDESIRQKKEYIEGLLRSLGGAPGSRPK
jgi:serine/threonine-protein kinase